MHLVFHAGHHKTGTTTFQHILASLQAPLRSHDIHVAVRRGSANMGPDVVYPAQRGDWSGYEGVLEEARAALTPDGILLFSAEDLENCLHDIAFGAEFMARARAHGVRSIRWVFVQRNEFEYFESLYAELCKHRQVLQYDLMAAEILSRGVFSCATPAFRWHFVFRYEDALTRFRQRVCDQVTRFTFAEFIRAGIGSALFGLFDRAGEYRSLCSRGAAEPLNVRLTPEAVERSYVATFLGLGMAGLPAVGDPLNSDALVARRLAVRSACRPAIRQLFAREMGTIPPSP